MLAEVWVPRNLCDMFVALESSMCRTAMPMGTPPESAMLLCRRMPVAWAYSSVLRFPEVGGESVGAPPPPSLAFAHSCVGVARFG